MFKNKPLSENTPLNCLIRKKVPEPLIWFQASCMVTCGGREAVRRDEGLSIEAW